MDRTANYDFLIFQSVSGPLIHGPNKKPTVRFGSDSRVYFDSPNTHYTWHEWIKSKSEQPICLRTKLQVAINFQELKRKVFELLCTRPLFPWYYTNGTTESKDQTVGTQLYKFQKMCKLYLWKFRGSCISTSDKHQNSHQQLNSVLQRI